MADIKISELPEASSFSTTDQIPIVSGGATKRLAGAILDSHINNTYIEPIENNVLGLQGTILWNNPNPNDAFSSQTISLSDSDFDYIDIIYNNYISRNTYEVDRVYKNYPSGEIGGTFNYSGKLYSGTRPLEITNNGSKIVFETAYGSRLDAYSFGTHDDWYIPIKIIGYKTGLF